MTGDVANFIFQTINFALLALLLSWLFFNPMRRAVEERRARLDAEVRDAERRLAQAKAAEEEADRKTAELAGRLEAMEAAARETAAQQAKAVIAEANASIQRERDAFTAEQASLARVEAEKAEAGLVDAAATMVRQLLGGIGGPDLDNSLIEAALAKCPAGIWGDVVVESARIVNEGIRRKIEAVAGGSVRYWVDAGLVAGARISGGFGVVDATAVGLALYASKKTVEAINGADRLTNREDARHAEPRDGEAVPR